GVAKGSDTTSLLPPPSAYSANNAAVGTFAVRDNNKTGIINSSLDIEWEPIKHLRLSSNDSYSVTSQVSDNYRPAYINGGLGQATSFNSRAYNLYSRNMISYVNTFNEDNTFNLYVFNELQKNLSSADQLLVKGTANDDIEGPLGNNAYSSYGGTTAYADQRSLAFGGSLEYNYKTKYIIDLSVRTDGTSTNGPNSGWSKNPTVGVRWNFQKENWFKNINWLDYGSLRFSWGSNIIPTGSIFDVYGKYTQGAGYNDESSIVNSWGNIPNPDFRATTSTQADWGFEGGFLHGFLDVTYDFYYKTVVNQVMSRNIADINGFSSISTNDLSQADYGHELSLNFRPFSGDHALKWNFSINGSYVRDVLTQLPGGTRQMIIQDQSTENLPVLYRLGRNTFTNLLFNTKGVYAANADVPINPADGKPLRVINNGVVTYLHAGDPIWADLNGDYVIDGADRVAVGDPAPKITGGINSFLQYKNFSLNVNVSYTLLRDIINTTAAHRFQGFADPTSPGVLVPIGQYNYWEKPGDIAKYPNPFDFLNYKAVQPFRYNQTMYMEDGSYFKVNDITLGYNFNRDLTKRWGITSCRVYVTAANVATFSHYSGPDPENVTDLGYDNSNGYPNRRNYTIGFNVQF
ncbi:MAG: SusC/RagA family TonB-linked outer membrane protein, partial [Arachidicoccus sp.]